MSEYARLVKADETQIISYSELDTGRQCAYKHLLSYKERWVQDGTSPALRKGTNWHAIMEVHYLSLKASVKVTSESERVHLAVKAVEAYINANLKAFEEDLDLLVWMYMGYVEKWGTDPAWEILAVEYHAQLPLPNPRKDGEKSPFILKAKIDLIVKDKEKGVILLIDHKSGKDLPKSKELDLDDQFGLYWYLLRENGHKIFAVIHSAARTQKNKDQVKHPQPLDTRFHRTWMSREPKEINRVAAEAFWQARLLYSMDPEETPRSTNPDTCNWKCGFTEPCLMARKGMPRKEAMTTNEFVQNFTRH